MGQLTLPASAAVYIDTAIVIYTVEANPTYFAALQPLWQQFQDGSIELVTSELTLMETLVTPLKNADTVLANDYEQLLTASEIQLIPISQSILRNAANLRVLTNMKTPDAIHASTSLSRSCTLFLTNDKNLRNIPNLSVGVLEDILKA